MLVVVTLARPPPPPCRRSSSVARRSAWAVPSLAHWRGTRCVSCFTTCVSRCCLLSSHEDFGVQGRREREILCAFPWPWSMCSFVVLIKACTRTLYFNLPSLPSPHLHFNARCCRRPAAHELAPRMQCWFRVGATWSLSTHCHARRLVRSSCCSNGAWSSPFIITSRCRRLQTTATGSP